jgi:lipid-A-disaccharide synthase
MHIGIVVGEVSGDILGASLLTVLKQRFPSCRFSGIGGSKMLAEGFDSLYPQDRLAVMGLIEPLKRLPELLRIRKHLFQYFVDERIDLFIGIDSPDFTLSLEKKLKQTGIKTIHYVSPSVWAWRQGRIKGIKKSVDWMLTLLTFEAAFYPQHNVPVTFVGHPLADQFPIVNDTLSARQQLVALLPKDSALQNGALQNTNTKIIACLPGSRRVEVEHIGGVLWQALSQLSDANPAHLHFVVPAVNSERRAQICLQLEAYPQLLVSVIEGHSQTVMAAADCVVMASGTTTLEAMLLKKPMVVVYKKDAFSYWLISRMLTVKHISLPNLLAGEALVPELIQDAATPEAIAQATQYWLDNPQKVSDLQQRFVNLHKQLSVNASETAANVVEHLLSPAI